MSADTIRNFCTTHGSTLKVAHASQCHIEMSNAIAWASLAPYQLRTVALREAISGIACGSEDNAVFHGARVATLKVAHASKCHTEMSKAIAWVTQTPFQLRKIAFSGVNARVTCECGFYLALRGTQPSTLKVANASKCHIEMSNAIAWTTQTSF